MKTEICGCCGHDISQPETREDWIRLAKQGELEDEAGLTPEAKELRYFKRAVGYPDMSDWTHDDIANLLDYTTEIGPPTDTRTWVVSDGVRTHTVDAVNVMGAVCEAFEVETMAQYEWGTVERNMFGLGENVMCKFLRGGWLSDDDLTWFTHFYVHARNEHGQDRTHIITSMSPESWARWTSARETKAPAGRRRIRDWRPRI